MRIILCITWPDCLRHSIVYTHLSCVNLKSNKRGLRRLVRRISFLLDFLLSSHFHTDDDLSLDNSETPSQRDTRKMRAYVAAQSWTEDESPGVSQVLGDLNNRVVCWFLECDLKILVKVFCLLCFSERDASVI